MTLLSVIVPVYLVEDYLADCLDSILNQSFTDIQLIAVDDASGDRCGEILSRYAERDPRLTVLTLDHNHGLGAARNAGLARSIGEYVWFVDSDDWLPEGALAAVADRLTRTGSDLLITAFTRYYPDGRTQHSPLSPVAVGRSSAEVVTLRDQPGLLSVLHIACNKIVRRRLLAELNLTFAPGWYEDVSFSFPLMLAARRISLLDRCCYAYRQRPAGAITYTVSDRHFEVFAHWDRVLAGLEAAPGVPVELRHLIFERMIWHLLQVLNHPRRVPPPRRREFFAEVVARYRAHLPVTGYQPPTGVLGLKYRLVGRGAYRMFVALRAARRAQAGLVARVWRPLTTGRVTPTSTPTVPSARGGPVSGELTDRVR